MISKYGVEIGTDKYNAYCEKQRITSTDKYIRNKFGEEYLTKVKDAKSHNFNYYLRLSNGDVEVAKELHKKYHEQRINNIGSISKNSLHLFNTIINKFNILSDSYYGENEFGLYDKEFKRYYKYDFTSTKYKFIIEFNGDVFHGNPKIYNETDRPNFFNTKKTCSEIWAYDKQKINLAKEHGFDVFVVWESEFNNEYIELVNRLFNTIKHKIK
ncbi:VSR endonuclease [Tenacibaculum phage PTm5]|nr:VSR endonuclease [Tenacibaculum phage PTm5]